MVSRAQAIAILSVVVGLAFTAEPKAASQEIYVGPNGLDSNTGSARDPLRTIAAAARRAGPGTTILVAAGDYAGGFRTDANGTAGKPVSYVSRIPGRARIIGGGSSPDAMAWWNRGDHVLISGFAIDGSGSAAVSWRFGFYNTGSDVTFQGNSVHHILTDAAAFEAASVSGMGGAGVEMDNWDGGRDTHIEHNVVHDIGPGTHDSSLVHGIYQIETGSVTDNVVYDVAGCGVSLWHGAGSIVIANNTIDNARGGGIFVGSGDSGPVSAGVTAGDDVRVLRNIVTRSVRGITEHGRTGLHNIYVGNLLFDNRSWPVKLQNGLLAQGTIQADPLFLDRDRHDYRLRPDSPAAGAGARGTSLLPP